jgi:predicted ATPase
MPLRMTIDRFSVTNFRSISHCDVDLAPLTFFVGANSSGKTSFLDALTFVSSALGGSLKKTVAERRGVHAILHYPPSFPSKSQFIFTISSSTGFACEYLLDLEAQESGDVSVAGERCRIKTPDGQASSYVVDAGAVSGSVADLPVFNSEDLFLSRLAVIPPFNAVYELLSGIQRTEPATTGLYEAVRRLQDLSSSLNKGTVAMQKAKGETVSAVVEQGLTARFRRLKRDHPDRLEIVHQYLRAIAPPFDRTEIIEANGIAWLRFIDKFSSGRSASFDMASVSSGLLNSAEILLELFAQREHGEPLSPIIIEEPEAMLHPGAIHVIRDSFVEASETRQVLVTSHSPDLLDEISEESIRSVYRDEGGTHIVPLDEATKSVLRDRLYTPGELLRQGGLTGQSG